jgi:hypothetical protein
LKILLVYPHYPDTFWSFRHALKFIARKLLPFSLAITYATFGFHFRKVAEKIGKSRKFDDKVCTG